MRHLILFLLFTTFSFTTIHAQCISGDCKNGKGIYLYPSGAKYVGDFKNGEIHGIGTCHYTNGSKYQGNWANRYPEGEGVKILADGTTIHGPWKKGKPVNVTAALEQDILVARGIRDDGTDIQSGCIAGNCINGKGTFAYPDGSKYSGEFANKKIHGWGTWDYPNGDKFVGSFQKGLEDGQGALYKADGSVLVGQWIGGEYIGQAKSGVLKVGCVEGNCQSGFGTYVYDEGVATYSGTFNNSLPDGDGTCEYSNGERYEGQWGKGAFNGVGTLFFNDGNTASGIWQNGTYLGKATPSAPPITDPVLVTESTPEITVKEASETKIWAVIIGVASYGHMPTLKYTDDDAYRIYAFLRSPEGGALSEDQISIMIDEEATKKNILNNMDLIFSKAGEKDLIVLYFSGHGLKGSFLPIDFDGFNNKIYHDEINDIFRNSPAKYKLVIADACHSGSWMATRGDDVESTLDTYYTSLAQAEPGTALIMSSKGEENSLESSGLRQGVFSHFLLRGLKGEADNDTNNVISVGELYNYIFDNVKDYTANRQSPVIKGDYDTKMTVGVVRQ